MPLTEAIFLEHQTIKNWKVIRKISLGHSICRQVMTQETQTDNIDSNSSLMKQQHNLFKTGSQFESQSERAKKRERSSDSSGLIQTQAKPSKIKRVNGQEVETDLLKLDFACPFYKWDPQKYGGKIGCAIYSSPDVDTMLRVNFH